QARRLRDLPDHGDLGHSGSSRLHPEPKREGVEEGDADLYFARENQKTRARPVKEERMTRYAGNAEALRALVREQEVHRDVYVSEEVFQLEMEHMFPNSWLYVGHASQ